MIDSAFKPLHQLTDEGFSFLKSLSSQYCAINNDIPIFQKIQLNFFSESFNMAIDHDNTEVKKTLGCPSRPSVHNNSLRKAAVSHHLWIHMKRA